MSSSSLLPDLASALANSLSGGSGSAKRTTSSQGDVSSSSSQRTVTPNVAEDAKRLANDADEFIHNSENKHLIQYVLMAIGAIVVFKTIIQSLFIVLVLVGPLSYAYMVQTCPAESSFDGKKELKRVLRGHHLPEDHPDKPKGYFEKMAAKVSASVQTQVMTSMPGCRQEMTSYKGAFWIVSMKVPSVNTQFYWLGALGAWKFVYSRELTASKSKRD